MYKKLEKAINSRKVKISVIGLGYVGLPLAAEFGKIYDTIGFDINKKRILELKKFQDRTNELSKIELKKSNFLKYTNDLKNIANADIYIVTVPTPIDEGKNPDLNPLLEATKAVASVLKKGNIVIYESTVYPGATEERCIPILEKDSNLILNKGFYAGYSPERINPGDKTHNIVNIIKVTSGSDKHAATLVDNLYKSIINAGTHLASSIKVAEAAKVIENTQRDINIALVNELSIIFDKLEINTNEVLKAAATKWNFLSFKPGLVGGHCIGVDPYYLTYKAQSVGIYPEVILSGRRINDSMASNIAIRLIREMNKKGVMIKNSNILVMGFAFKENCPDHRNTKVIDLINSLSQNGLKIHCYDPCVDQVSVFDEYQLKLIKKPILKKYDAIVIAVAHDEFKKLSIKNIKKYMKKHSIIFDVKNIFPKNTSVISL